MTTVQITPDNAENAEKPKKSGAMMSGAKQVFLLMVKNFILQIRSPILSALIIILPVAFSCLLVWTRTLVDDKVYSDPTTWDSFELLPWDDLYMFNSNQSNTLVVYYYPKNTQTDAIVTKAIQFTDKLTFTGTNDLDAKLDDLERVKWSETNELGLVKFEPQDGTSGWPSDGSLPTKLKMTIRLSHSRRYPLYGLTNVTLEDNPRRDNWKTEDLYDPVESGIRSELSKFASIPPGYYEEGFMTLQLVLNLGIIGAGANPYNFDDSTELIQMQRMPYPPYKENQYSAFINTLLPFVFVIAMISLVLMVVKQLVLEKERRLKESMKMMGLQPWTHNFAWILHFAIIFVLICLLKTILLTTKIVNQGAIFQKSSFGGIFLIFLVYSFQTLTCCFFLSTLFSSANTAAVMTGVIWFFTYFPYLFLDPGNPNSFYDSLGPTVVSLLCVIPNLGFCFSILMTTSLENRGIGVSGSSFNTERAYDDSLTLTQVFTGQLVSGFVYLILTWYFDNVFPGTFGIAQHPLFFLKRSYWCGRPSGGNNKEGADETDRVTTPANQGDAFEEDPGDMEVGIFIKNLSKKYGNGKLAVKGVTVKMFEGQITAFLGHNGAGKTSTISMLTGLYEPTSGTAFINNLDIRKDMDKIRQNLGICPQHDVLFDNLTVAEHIDMFCRLKGMGDKVQIDKEMDTLLRDLQLTPKKNAKSSELSGGMKRKLSVALAFCGGSKIVILDEPTSGMDPSARRRTWDLIQNYRKGRTIILTTHYMDEADFLGDRIAIMSSGQLVCAGSSLFLKNKYGVGYHMVAEKKQNCNPDNVFEFIRKFVPGVEKESNVGAELSFRLPHDSATNFPSMFDSLDKQKDSLGVASYGVSVTTLEEVFMRVGHLNEEDEADGGAANSDVKPPSYSSANTTPAAPRKREDVKVDSCPEFSNISGTSANSMTIDNGHDDKATNGESNNHENGVQYEGNGTVAITSFSTVKPFTVVEKNTGLRLFAQQFRAMVEKRYINTKRSFALSIAQLVVPVIFTLLALLSAKFIAPSEDQKPFTFSLNKYSPNYVAVFNDGNFNALTTDYKEKTGQHTYPDTSAVTDPVQFFSDNGEGLIDEYVAHWIIGASFTQEDGMNKFTAWFNGQPLHSAPLALQALLNALNDFWTSGQGTQVTVVNHPLTRTLEQQAEAADQGEIESSLSGFLLSFYCVGVGIGFLAASFGVFLIKEKEVKAKHIQMVSGVNVLTYWLSVFLWDYFCYFLCVVLLTALLAAFNLEGWTGKLIVIFFFVMMMYGWGVIPQMYAFSFLSNIPANGFLVTALFNIVGAIAFCVTYLIMSSLESDMGPLMVIGFFFPQFSATASMVDISSMYNLNELRRKMGLDELDYIRFKEPGIGRFVAFLLIDGLMFWAIVFLVEFGGMSLMRDLCCLVCCYCKRKSQLSEEMNENAEDVDIVDEKNRILSGNNSNDVLVIQGIKKTYRNTFGAPVMKAVHGLYAGVAKGECFGLLGVNGAGKSTTFNMLTGDLMIDEGTAFIDNVNIRSNIVRARQRMGYCPQFDAIIENMTGTETLEMYARIRGVPENKIDVIVQELMEALQLTVYKDRQVGTYSGGNKRKISTAIALMGSPPVVFLDEPSSGMDPVTRRRLWNVLSRVREDGRSIVITSHSMEECEALCTRMVVMVNGRFQCLGSLQHLKSKYGSGFTLICKTRSEINNDAQDLTDSTVNTDAAGLKEYIERQFQGCILKDAHITATIGYLHYELDASHSWSTLFSAVEEAKPKFNVTDYIISQTTLEQIFLNFARQQRDEFKKS